MIFEKTMTAKVNDKEENALDTTVRTLTEIYDFMIRNDFSTVEFGNIRIKENDIVNIMTILDETCAGNVKFFE